MHADATASPLDPAQVEALDSLLDALLDLPAGERLRRLESLPATDPRVRAEVERLLRTDADAGEFLCAPAALPDPGSQEDCLTNLRLGAWRLGREVGRGGMGVVYEARRVSGDFDQRVAVKLLQWGADSTLARFEAERRILAKLDHPGIARLLDGGASPDGRPYMVMEFVDGEPITAACTRLQASLQQRLRLFMQVCDAVAYAHRHLVIHRDLKPGNVMIDREEHVKLLDFGIAKLMDVRDSGLTQAVTVVLSPQCAAPEQLEGEPITTQTDVFALGLMLFQLMTGEHPWFGKHTPAPIELRRRLQSPAPQASAIAASNPECPVPADSLRGDVDAVLAKALRREPAQRYATVHALKEDVERILRGDPVMARSGARLYVLGRLLRQHRWAVAAACSIVVSLSVGLGLAAWQARVAAQERDAARREAAREEAVRYGLTTLFRGSLSQDASGATQTARAMVDRSAQRVLKEYRDRPELQGPLVLSLADLYGALEDVAGAATLLDGFISQPGPQTNPAVLADARQKLASLELLLGNFDRAAGLLGQSDAFWTHHPAAYAEERIEGLKIRAQLQRSRGDFSGAIDTARQAIEQRIALSGHDHRETAILYNSLALSLTSANRLDEALNAYHESLAIYQALDLGDGLDAQVIRGNTGTLELHLGHLRQAERMLVTAITQERALAGDSAAVAAALGHYGRLLTIENRPDEAVKALRESVDIAGRYTSANSPVTLQNRLLLGEAQLVQGDRAGARMTLTGVLDSARAAGKPAELLRLRILTALGRVESAEGKTAQARQDIAEAIAGLREEGARGEGSLGQALLDGGELAQRAGDTSAALRLLRESVAVRTQLKNPRWELAISEERLSELIAREDPHTAAELLRRASPELAQQLGAAHPEASRAVRQLASLPASMSP